MDLRTPNKYNKNELPKRVRLNLLKVLNKSIEPQQPERRFVRNEIMRVQRERLKSRYHLQPHPFFYVNKANDHPVVCEIDPEKLSARKQVEKFVASKNSSNTIMRGLSFMKARFSDTLPPYDFDKCNGIPAKSFSIVKMSSGKYLNFGMQKHLQESTSSVISVNIIVYLQSTQYKGASRPTYLTIFAHQIDTNKTFVVGIYSGIFPIEFIGNEIFQPLVAEILYLQKNDIRIKDRSYRFNVSSIICDPIANSLLTCTTMPTSMFGCSKCKAEGRILVIENQVMFPPIAADLRDDEDFKFCVVTEHHLATPILQETGIGLISQISIDYKHLVCLGVMKSLLELWLNGDLKYRLNKDIIDTINTELMELAPSCPTEFESHPKRIDELSKWTPYDYRQFLLYYGPIVLRENLQQTNYVHFLYLNLAMRIALDQTNSEDINYYVIGQLMQSFVRDFTRIYGKDKVDYNIHNLLHIENVVRNHKNLETVGGFQCYSTVEAVETLLTKRTFESDISLNDIGTIVERNNQCELEKHKVISVGTSISTKMPDNFFVVPNGIACIKQIGFTATGKLMLQGHRFLQSTPFTAIKTTSQNIMAIQKLGNLEMWSPEQIISKAVVFKTEEAFYAMPLLSFQ